MNEFNKTLQREIATYDEAIIDMKSVLDMIDHARDPNGITLSVDEESTKICPFGVHALKSAISAKIIQYKSAIMNARRQMI